jgi:hypothetical protein
MKPPPSVCTAWRHDRWIERAHHEAGHGEQVGRADPRRLAGHGTDDDRVDPMQDGVAHALDRCQVDLIDAPFTAPTHSLPEGMNLLH